MLDKPSGLTSQQAVSQVKRLLGVKKAGHSGSLDPAVTGVLPIFLGRATRLSGYVTQERKSYAGTVCFGWATDTQDATGAVVARGDASGLLPDAVVRAAERLTGDILQTPPAYSAVKVSGVRSYALARRGESVALQPRPIQVHRFEFVSFAREGDAFCGRFVIECGKGTYVRTICHDLGILVGVPAHMSELVRLSSGPFILGDAVGFDELARLGDKAVLPAWRAVEHLPVVSVAGKQLESVLCGRPLAGADGTAGGAAPEGADDGDLVRVHAAHSGDLVALYRVSREGTERRLTAHKVFN